MKVKFGAIIVDGRNKVGGHVLSKNRAGAYMRTKVTPVNPQTFYQMSARETLTQWSQAWRALTNDQRASWNSSVGNWAKTDIFGDIKNPSGFNLYVRLNTNIEMFGGAALDEAPTPGEIPVITFSSITIDSGTGDDELAFSPTIPANTGVKLFITPAVSPGKSFVKSEYRLLKTLVATATSPDDFTVAYEGRFGVPATGQKVFARLSVVNVLTGQESTPTQLSTTVVNTP